MTTHEQAPLPAVGAPLERGVRPCAAHVDAVMRAVYAMLRSAPNFDGRLGEVETAVWSELDLVQAEERERCAVVVKTRADKIAAEAARAAEDGKRDEVLALRAMAWQLTVAEREILGA